MQLRNGVTSSFVGGEATPEFAGRVDRDELATTARYIKNFLPTCQGGLKKFWGTWLISKLVDGNTKCRLVPFSGLDEPICLLFCNNQVYKITKDSIQDQAIPIKTSAIMDASYSQNNAVIYFASKTQRPFYLRYDGTRFTYKNMELEQEPFFPLSWTGLYRGAIRANGYQGDVTITPIIDSTDEYSLPLPANLGDLEYNDIISTYIEQDGEIIPFAHLYVGTNGNCNTTRVTLVRVRGGAESDVISAELGNQQYSKFYNRFGNGVPDVYCIYRSMTYSQLVAAFRALTPMSITSGKLNFLTLPSGHQSGDQYYIKVTTSSSGPGSYYLGYEEHDYYLGCLVNGGVSDPGHVIGSAADAVDIESSPRDFGTNDVLGMRIRVHLQTGANVAVWAKGVSITANQVYYSDGKYYKALSSGTAGDAQPTHSEGIRSDGNINFEYMHDGYATGTVVEVPSSTSMIVRVDGYLPITNSNGSQWDFDHFQWSQWGYKGEYPDQVFSFSGRLGYIFDSTADGSWLQMSKSDSFYDFGTTEDGQTTDICGINVLLSGHPDNNIQWILAAERLYMGSYSGEYKISGTDTRSNVITPTSLAVSPVSAVGGARVRPIRYNRKNIFVSSTGQLLYNLVYNYQTDDYSPSDMSTIGEDLLHDGVQDMAIIKNKESIVTYRTKLGDLRYFSSEPDSDFLSFYRADLKGEVLASCVSEGSGKTVQFVVVKRGEEYFVEYIDSTEPSYCLCAVKMRVMGDIVYNGYRNNNVIVLPEEGRYWDVYADPESGYIYSAPMDVINDKEIVIGEKLECEIHMTPNYDSKLEGAVQKSVRYIVRLLNSGPFSYGSSNDFSTYYPYEMKDDDILTGDILLPASFGYMQGQNIAEGPYPNNTGVALNLQTDAPLPFNLLMVGTIYV